MKKIEVGTEVETNYLCYGAGIGSDGKRFVNCPFRNDDLDECDYFNGESCGEHQERCDSCREQFPDGFEIVIKSIGG